MEEEAFYNELLYDNVIKNKTFNFRNQSINIDGFTNNRIEFHNCKFIAEEITFKNINNPELTIRFNNCLITSKLEFINCIFDNLEFFEVDGLKSLKLSKGYEVGSQFLLNRFYFHYEEKSCITVAAEFNYFGCIFKNEFSIQNLKHIAGYFIVENSQFGKEITSDRYNNFSFNNSHFTNTCIARNIFLGRTSFVKSTFDYLPESLVNKKYKNTMFYDNNFKEVGFSECDFTSTCHFWNCRFNDIAYFENIQNINSTDLRFVESTFDKYLSFDKASIFKIVIQKCDIKYIASFQDSVFSTIFIDKTIFEKLALFDNIKILDINGCNRRTIRNIKQQLQKAENKIDYNRFRAYELAAYYNELKWHRNFKDWFILSATKISTGFDYSWTRAFCFTTLTGLGWYCGLYFIEYHGSYNPKKVNEFFVGAFRFFLITDFYSPFEERKYLDYIWSWFPFVIGKIFIAFGIYEMIQAFRKFKA